MVWEIIQTWLPRLHGEVTELLEGPDARGRLNELKPGVRMRPRMICHADWSKSGKGRWCAEAILSEKGSYEIESAHLVGAAPDFVDGILNRVRAGDSALLGFDFPIGVPRHYAQQAGITSFREWLLELGDGPWREFFEVCEAPDEITVHRPFYPRLSVKGVKQDDLVKKLGANNIGDLLRVCERGGNGSRKACSLFWTLGANAVGKAAIAGWKEVIVPLLRREPDRVCLWPFDGSLDQLLAPGKAVLAETYPAEYYSWFSFNRTVKTEQSDRKAFGCHLLHWAEERRDVILSAGLKAQLTSGFENDDAFDAVVGLFAMLKVIFEERGSCCSQTPESMAIEGWMLGRKSQR